jgi:hypothetical protein
MYPPWIWVDPKDRPLKRPRLMLGVTSAVERLEALDRRRKESRPTELPPDLVKAVAKSTLLGLTQPLPANTKGLHKMQKGATCSVAKEAATEWWESDSGLKWQAERARLLLADQALSEPTQFMEASNLQIVYVLPIVVQVAYVLIHS